MQPKSMSDALYFALGAMFADATVLKEVADKLDHQGFDTVESLAAETVHTLVSLYGLKGAHARKVAMALGAESAPAQHAAPLHVTVSTEKTPMTMPLGGLIALFAGGSRDADVLAAMRERVPLVLTDKAKDTDTVMAVDAAETESWCGSPAYRSASVGDTVRGHFRVRAVDDIVAPTVELDAVDLTVLDNGFNGKTDWRPYGRDLRVFLYYVFHELPAAQRPVTSRAAALDALTAARNDLTALYGIAWAEAMDSWRDARKDDPALEGRIVATLYPTRASRARSAGLEGGHGRPFLGGSPALAPTTSAAVGERIDLSRSLKGHELKAFSVALQSAFPSLSRLEQCVSFGLRENLAAITSGGSLDNTVFTLLTWAASRGRLADLLRAARAANDDNPDLRAFAARCEPAPAGPTWDADTKRRFRVVLANLYPSEKSLRRIALDAQIEPQRVDFDGSATNSAFALIEEAVRGGQINALLAVARQEYPAALSQQGF